MKTIENKYGTLIIKENIIKFLNDEVDTITFITNYIEEENNIKLDIKKDLTNEEEKNDILNSIKKSFNKQILLNKKNINNSHYINKSKDAEKAIELQKKKHIDKYNKLYNLSDEILNMLENMVEIKLNDKIKIKLEEIKNTILPELGHYLEKKTQLFNEEAIYRLLGNRQTDKSDLIVKEKDYEVKIKHIKEKQHILSIDLNNLKSINDEYGHTHGDAMLVSFAEILKEKFPNSIHARIGGDEFMSIQDNIEETIKIKNFLTSEEFSNLMLEKINNKVNKKINKEFKFMASSGYVEYINGKMTVKEYISYSDNFMYIEKSNLHLKHGLYNRDTQKFEAGLGYDIIKDEHYSYLSEKTLKKIISDYERFYFQNNQENLKKVKYILKNYKENIYLLLEKEMENKEKDNLFGYSKNIVFLKENKPELYEKYLEKYQKEEIVFIDEKYDSDFKFYIEDLKLKNAIEEKLKERIGVEVELINSIDYLKEKTSKEQKGIIHYFLNKTNKIPLNLKTLIDKYHLTDENKEVFENILSEFSIINVNNIEKYNPNDFIEGIMYIKNNINFEESLFIDKIMIKYLRKLDNKTINKLNENNKIFVAKYLKNNKLNSNNKVM